MKEQVQNRIVALVLGVTFLLGCFLLAMAAKAQSPVCSPGVNTETCVALLNQKSQEIDAHLHSTDNNVSDITNELKQINITLTEIEQNESWERALWGSLLVLSTAGLGGIHLFRKKKTAA